MEEDEDDFYGGGGGGVKQEQDAEATNGSKAEKMDVSEEEEDDSDSDDVRHTGLDPHTKAMHADIECSGRPIHSRKARRRRRETSVRSPTSSHALSTLTNPLAVLPQNQNPPNKTA